MRERDRKSERERQREQEKKRDKMSWPFENISSKYEWNTFRERTGNKKWRKCLNKKLSKTVEGNMQLK